MRTAIFRSLYFDTHAFDTLHPFFDIPSVHLVIGWASMFPCSSLEYADRLASTIP